MPNKKPFKEKIRDAVNRHLLQKYFTIMLVPHTSEKSLHINVTMGFIYAAMACFIFVLSVAGFIISRQFDYSSALIAEKTLKDKVEVFSRQLIETQAYIENVKDIEGRMKELLGLKTKQAVVESMGQGGPSGFETDNLARVMANDFKMSDEEFRMNMDFVNKGLSARISEWNSLNDYIKRQNKIFNATPSGMPVNGRIVSYFGNRMHPIRKEMDFHQGLDIDAYRGTPIRATSSGLVTYAGWAGGYGQLVVVNHGYGFSTRYGHMSKIRVKLLQKVKKGDIVGYVGSTGTSTGPHVHYEVRVNESEVNPLKYLSKPKI